MLSFNIINEHNKDEILDSLLVKMPEADGEYMAEIVESLLEDGECEYAISSSNGCLLVRIFDEKYLFIYPVAVEEGADESIAAEHLRKYAVREEIPLIFTDVPKEELSNLLPLFRHANVDAQDENGECFTVKIMSEAALFDRLPTVDYEDIYLDEITECDDGDYARLCKDKDTNSFWGYDYSADEANPEDSYFREMAESEFNRGVAMTFAVRYYGRFAGEATLYAFDLIGGCECGVRILPEYRGEGVATKALFALRSIAERAGLINLCATVDERNEASKKLCKKCFDACLTTGERQKYYTKL